MKATWLQRFLNRIGWRKDTLVCMRQDETWCWPAHLGQRIAGECEQCTAPIYYEKQNKPFRKICHRCAGW